MAQQLDNHPSVEFIIGDVRDKEQLSRAMHGIDYVVHGRDKNSANSEYNPSECIKTNIFGAMNVIDAALARSNA